MKRDLISIADLTRADLDELFTLALRFKEDRKKGWPHPLLAGRTLAMIFEKPSLRTRVTFEAGMVQLGGYAVYLSPPDIGLGSRESARDVARNLSRWVDLIMVRTFSHAVVLELAQHATVPVINGLSDLLHPCQVLADCLTLIEQRGRLDGLKVAFIGDGNNVVNSWLNAAAKLPFTFTLACPPGYEPDADVLAFARRSGAQVTITNAVEEAVRGADAVYTDVWTSMGQEKESARRREAFRDYQVNASVVRLAKKEALVMHCLPAHRGEEITADVLDGPQSVVLEQAENRLHIQKAIMVWLLR
ncbi:MAG TPA: ornithine carbamoyltransferase [Methylomirabilota bacterium]|jgi:ornithine carbamoyltransferase|nr:ornithine carbamoyltransferase [Methylomirabilota bacterium]